MSGNKLKGLSEGRGEEVYKMISAEFEQVLSKGENLTVDFKTWIHAKDMRQRISLAVDEFVAFANAKGGTVYMGVEFQR